MTTALGCVCVCVRWAATVSIWFLNMPSYFLCDADVVRVGASRGFTSICIPKSVVMNLLQDSCMYLSGLCLCCVQSAHSPLLLRPPREQPLWSFFQTLKHLTNTVDTVRSDVYSSLLSACAKSGKLSQVEQVPVFVLFSCWEYLVALCVCVTCRYWGTYPPAPART